MLFMDLLTQRYSLQLYFLTVLSISAIPAMATDMDKSMQEGYAAAEAALSVGKSAAAEFNPGKEFDNYSDNPSESSWYQGGTQTSTHIGDIGNQQLAESEIGQLIRDSFINNPADTIHYDSDMIKNSDAIRENADVIAGGTGTDCTKQEISKVTWTTHACEQGKNIAATCTRTAQIRWEPSIGWENTEFTVYSNQLTYTLRNGAIYFSFRMPYTGWVSAFTLYGWGSRDYLFPIKNTTSFLGKSFTLVGTTSGNPNDIGQANYFTVPEQKINEGTMVEGALVPQIGLQDYFLQNFRDRGANKITVKLALRKQVQAWAPSIEWVENCPIDKENAVKLREWCSQPGGTKTVEKDGKAYQVYSDCWQYSEEWQVYESDDNTCTRWQADVNCSEGTRTCLEKIGNYCVREALTYQCQHTEKSEGWVCGGKFFCADGKCAALQENSNGDFSEAVSALAALAAAGQDVIGMDPDTITAFTGKGMACRKAAAGFSNCCKSGGWGHDAGLAHCNDEERSIGIAKEKRLTIDVGEYCDKKVLGVCLQKKHAYCVFDSKLARIVQQYGRRDQLGIGFGGAKNPDCRGIRIEELQRIAFDQLDFTDFYEDLNNSVALPDQDALTERIKQQIQQSIPGGVQ